jgi:hypothetical protein
MWDVSIRKTCNVVLGSYPLLIVRALVYFGIAVAYLTAIGAGAGFGSGLGTSIGPEGRIPGAFWGAMAGFALISVMLRWLREYLLYFVEAPYIAAITLLVDREASPATQIAHALELVQGRFVDVQRLLEIDRLVQGASTTLIAGANLAAGLLPRGATALEAPTNKLLQFALRFSRAVTLARIVRAESNNPWQVAAHALVLQAQQHRVVYGNAMLLAGLSHSIALIVFLIALAPASAFAHSLSAGSGAITLLLALVIAWSFQRALLEPFAIAALLAVSLPATDGVRPDPAWDARLAEASPHFQELKARAAAVERQSRIRSQRLR